MTLKVGIIAEDVSDVTVTAILIKKMTRTPFRIHRFVGFGCGKIKRKSRDWAENLKAQGCTRLILIHDLDKNDLRELTVALGRALDPFPILKSVIVIPVHEIEAWLLADHEAIKKALKLRKPAKKVANPEAIANAKEALRDYIAERSEKKVEYFNSIHNEKIAAQCEVENLTRCPSFLPLKNYVKENL